MIARQLFNKLDGQAETQEALEVVGDARAELKKERPNNLRLRSLLAGLARDVRVVDGTQSPSEFLGRMAPLIGGCRHEFRKPLSEELNVAHEVDTMDENASPTDPLQSDYEAALAEEHRLWRAIHDPRSKATDRVVAYARWRAAVKRLKDLATPPCPGETE